MIPCFQLPGAHFRGLMNSLVWLSKEKPSVCLEEEAGGIQMRTAVCQDQSSIAHVKESKSQILGWL